VRGLPSRLSFLERLGVPVSPRGKLTNEEIALAFLIGLGMLLMIAAGLVGVMFGAAANASMYGILFLLGLLTFLAGLGLWIAIGRPWEQFDDINVPKDSGHHAAH
jgi:uncharacterized membrane protein